MSTNYMQTDIRWKNTIYCGEPCEVSGCGAMVLASILNVYPPEIMAWITANGYASNKSGTYQTGINACLNAYGYTGEKLTGRSQAGKDVYALLKAVERFVSDGGTAILLMGGQETGCISNYWSRAGHYISIVDADADALKVYDSAYDARSGWHTLGDFNGDVKHAWISSPPGRRSLLNMDFNVIEVRHGSIGADVRLLQMCLKCMGYYKGDIDGSFGDETLAAVIQCQEESGYLVVDGVAGYNTFKYILQK